MRRLGALPVAKHGLCNCSGEILLTLEFHSVENIHKNCPSYINTYPAWLNVEMRY